MPLDDSVNVILVVLEDLLLYKTRWRVIVKIFELVVCWLDSHNFFVLNETNRHKNLNENKINYPIFTVVS